MSMYLRQAWRDPRLSFPPINRKVPQVVHHSNFISQVTLYLLLFAICRDSVYKTTLNFDIELKCYTNFSTTNLILVSYYIKLY